MNRIRYLTAGESHGQALTGILEGIPAGLQLTAESINSHLARRQRGYGRGERMKIEKDRVRILSGIRFGKTLGSPISLQIENKDWENWSNKMSVESHPKNVEQITVPRPGHADLAGKIKYGHHDIRNVLERASARETAIRVALGAITTNLLSEFNVKILSQVVQIGNVKSNNSFLEFSSQNLISKAAYLKSLEEIIEESQVRCVSPESEKLMIKKIDEAIEKKEAVGGIFEVVAFNLPIGLGSFTHWDRKMDGKIASSMMSIPGIKSVEIGLGKTCAELPGSKVHDNIYHEKEKVVYRKTNNAGGLEGGVTNGEPLVIRCGMKPIPTLMKPLDSVNLINLEPTVAFRERSDSCAVPAAAVVAEAVLSLVLADVFCEKFGGDSISEMQANYENYSNASVMGVFKMSHT